MLEGAKKARYGVRDHLLMLMMYRHGLRVSEAIALRRDNVNLQGARLWVRRLKDGLSVEHPIAGDELRAIKRYLATRTDQLPWLFLSERGQPLTTIVRPIPGRGPPARVPACKASTRTCCGTRAATTLPTGAPTCAPCRTISGIATPGTPCTTRAWPVAASKGYGNSCWRRLRSEPSFGVSFSTTGPRAVEGASRRACEILRVRSPG